MKIIQLSIYYYLCIIGWIAAIVGFSIVGILLTPFILVGFVIFTVSTWIERGL